MRKLLIFDYDGTLHETMLLYRSAVIDTLKWMADRCPVDPESIPETKFSEWIGMSPPDMWDDLIPGMENELKEQAIKRVGDQMNTLAATDARWYEGVEGMLSELKTDGWRMVILSNCTESYAHAHWKQFQMERWFDAFLACETYDYLAKEWIIWKLLDEPELILNVAAEKGADIDELTEELETYKGGRVIVIGDKKKDKNGADFNQLEFIGCSYGYGSEEELEDAPYLAETPEEIAKWILN